MDFCVACHSEGDQDVRWDRPSHADLAFDTCASAGCHNYHDNACHNNHKDSPRTDLEVGDVMGGIVIRFPVD